MDDVPLVQNHYTASNGQRYNVTAFRRLTEGEIKRVIGEQPLVVYDKANPPVATEEEILIVTHIH